MQFDGELYGRHRSENIDLILALNRLAVWVEENILKIGLVINVSDVETVIQ